MRLRLPSEVVSPSEGCAQKMDSSTWTLEQVSSAALGVWNGIQNQGSDHSQEMDGGNRAGPGWGLLR